MPDVYVANTETPKAKLTEPSNLPTLGIRFETQEADEKVVLLLRKHWITNTLWINLAIIMLLAPLILPFFPILTFMPLRFQLVATLLWYLLTTAFVFEKFLSWYFNVYIVTNERVIDYDFFNLLYKQTTDAELDKIQDISSQMGGIPQTIFNYGNVMIQTAGEVPNLEFELVPDPAEVTKVIRELEDLVPADNSV